MKSNAKTSAHHHAFTAIFSKRDSAGIIFIARALLLLLLFSTFLPAQSSIVPKSPIPNGGDPVPGFGTSGVVMTDFAGGNDSASGVAATLAGKIVAAGLATVPGTGTDFAMACYEKNGGLDTSFGDGGKVTLDFFGGNDVARGIAVQPDGKIVLAGLATNGGTRQFGFARFNIDGSLDPTFDQDGKLALNLGSTSEAFKVAVQADGKIVAVGESRPQNSLDFTLIRLNPDGSLDNLFGTNGVVRHDFGNADRATDLAIDEENIFVCGIVLKSSTDSDFGLARFNISNGSLSDELAVSTDFFLKQDGANSIRIRDAVPPVNERHLIVSGFATKDTSDFAVAAYDFNLSLITSFFNQGKDTFDFTGGRDLALDLLEQPDGDIVASGWAADGANFDLGIVKWDREGRLDSDWGLQGEYTLDTSSGANNVAFDAMYYDNTIVIGGTGLNPASGNDDFIITQHENEKLFEFSKHASPNPAVAGDIVTYTFTIKNLTDIDRAVYITDTLPDGVSALLAGDFKTTVSNGTYVIGSPINVPSGETRKTTLRVKTMTSGLITNNAVLNAEYGTPILLGNAEASSEVKAPEITDVTREGKNLTLIGLFGDSSGANQSSDIGLQDFEPQASCPVVLFDGVEQKTKQDADNPTTGLIVKKGYKKLAPGQTVRIRVRLCSGIETGDFIYTRPQ